MKVFIVGLLAGMLITCGSNILSSDNRYYGRKQNFKKLYRWEMAAIMEGWFWTRKKVLRTIPIFKGWKLIKEESDWEYAKRITGLKEIKPKWEGEEIGDKENSRKRI